METERVFDYRWPWSLFVVIGIAAVGSLLIGPATFLVHEQFRWGDVGIAILGGVCGLVYFLWGGAVLCVHRRNRPRLILTRSGLARLAWLWRIRVVWLHYDVISEATIHCLKGDDGYREIRLRRRDGGVASITAAFFTSQEDARACRCLLEARLAARGVPMTIRHVWRNPLLPRQFTIAGLLIATTIVAMVLSLMTYIADGDPIDKPLVWILAFQAVVLVPPVLLIPSGRKTLALAGCGYSLGILAEFIGVGATLRQAAATGAVPSEWYPLSWMVYRIIEPSPPTATPITPSFIVTAFLSGTVLSALIGAVTLPPVWYAAAKMFRALRRRRNAV